MTHNLFTQKLCTLLLIICLSNFASSQNASNFTVGSFPGDNLTGYLSVTGPYAGLSLSNRAISNFVSSPTIGERWVIYNYGAPDGKLRFWSGADKFVFTNAGNMGINSDPGSSRLFISAEDESVGSAISLRQSNNNLFGFDFSVDQSLDGNFFLQGVAGGGKSTILSASRNTGFVGIGTDYPAARLDVLGTTSNPLIARFTTPDNQNRYITVGNSAASMNIGIGASGSTAGVPYIWSNNDKFMIGTDGNPTLFIKGLSDGNPGNVGIATTSPQSKLAVNGIITAKGVKIVQIGWADYVFEPHFVLKPLSDVEAYIRYHKHLPDVPSEATIEEEGLDVAEMQKIQMQKIEELYLYIIEQQKEIEMLKKQIGRPKFQKRKTLK